MLALLISIGIFVNTAGSAEQSIRFSYVQHQTLLDPVMSFDLLGGPAHQAIPVQGNIRSETLLVKEISRTLPSIWQIRIPEQVSPDSLRVSYQITGANGKSGCLSHTGFPKADISVTLHPLPPRIIEQENVEIEEEEGAEGKTTAAQTPPIKKIMKIQRINVIEGGVVISFHPNQIQYAGTYAGTLQIMIHGL